MTAVHFDLSEFFSFFGDEAFSQSLDGCAMYNARFFGLIFKQPVCVRIMGLTSESLQKSKKLCYVNELICSLSQVKSN